MAKTIFDFICYEPKNGIANVYLSSEGSRWYGSIHSRAESNERIRSVHINGGRCLYRIRIRTKPSPNTGSL